MCKPTDLHIRILEKGQISCEDVTELLGDYADNELIPSLVRRLDDHIDTCTYCTEVKAGYMKTIELAKELRNKPAPRDVQNRLRAALNQRLGLNLSQI